MVSNSVLELACGTGRLAQVFLRNGAHYTGLEIIPDFVSASIKKLNKYGQNVSIIEGDMCNFNLDKKFDFIFIGFNSFLHLLNDRDAMDCFHSVQKHMHKNSHFILDMYIPNPLFLYRPIGSRFHVLEYTDSISHDHIFVEENNQYDPETEINKITWYFSTTKKKDFDIRQFFVRMYYPSKMNQILIDSGFTICHQWGDYYRTSMTVDSKLQIYDVVLQ